MEERKLEVRGIIPQPLCEYMYDKLESKSERQSLKELLAEVLSRLFP